MSFYLKPPRGVTELHLLQDHLEQRLTLFKRLENLEGFNHNNFSFLIEDTAPDRISHFFMRLIAVKSPAFLEYFSSSELRLFQWRFNSYNLQTQKRFFQVLLRHCLEIKKSTQFINCRLEGFLTTLRNICSKVLTKWNHFFNDRNEFNGDKKHPLLLQVPFQYCSVLITTYKVPLKKGYVLVSHDHLKDLLLALFRTYLHTVLKEMQNSRKVQNIIKDERIQSVMSALLSGYACVNSYSLSINQVDAESKLFPPCMQNLYQILKKHHRLSHESRLNLSLFLKDIGMSLEDSITFWEYEYSQQHTGSSKCQHNWQQNVHKYVYSIRHMYGLEGGRKIYKTRSCAYFQKPLINASDEGGCPFKHFDNKSLSNLLRKNNCVKKENLEIILQARQQCPTKACSLFCNQVNQTENCLESVLFKDPVQYFFFVKGL